MRAASLFTVLCVAKAKVLALYGRDLPFSAHAQSLVRAAMVLPPLPDLRDVAADPSRPGARTRALELGDLEKRALDLVALHGVTKAQAAQIMGLGKHQLDYALRRGYRALGCHSKIGAAAAWRARAAQSGHQPNAEDLAALHQSVAPPRAERMHTLSARQQEVLALAASGVRRKDLPEALGCSGGAVHSLVHAINRGLGVRSLEAAVAAWLQASEQAQRWVGAAKP
jgi:DNA-binding CsgD family transcriptional regulator